MRPLIVISGGSRGIGRAIARRFAQAGFDVATCGRNADHLRQLQTDLESEVPGARVLTFRADLAVASEVAAFVSFVQSLDRPVDVLVNNAGFFLPGQLHNEPDGTLAAMIDTNLYSAYHLTRGLIGEMVARRAGYVFTICSTASIVPYPNGGAYCVSKFALLGFTRVLREEMKPHGVRVTAVLPGATLTDSWAGTDLPADRFIDPADVAEAVHTAWAMADRTVLEELLIRPQLGDIT